MTRVISAFLFGLFFLGSFTVAYAQNTEFTYQGSLKNGTAAANGPHDLEFALFDSSSGGSQLGATLLRGDVTVTDGIFSVNLDFGSQFPGAERFLEIRIRPAGGGAFATLSPRQPLTSTPYAVKSFTANSADNAANAVNFSGALSGDVTGTQAATTVARLRGTNVSPTAPGNGQVLKFNSAASQWEPGTDNTGTSGGGGTITGVTAGTGLTGGGTTGSVTLGIANGGVGTQQLADSAVTDAKISSVSGSKVSGAVATASNATQLGGVPASSYLQSVAINSTLTGNGSSGLPLGISLPLGLNGNAPLPGVLSVNNSAGNSAAITATLNGGGSAIRGVNSGQGSGVYGTSNDASDLLGGVHGEAPDGNGVVGVGGRAGVYGLSSTGNGVGGNSSAAAFAGVSGFHQNTGAGVSGLSTNGKGIHGISGNGFAGYFQGRSYFSENVGIGTLSPTSKLHTEGSDQGPVIFGNNLAGGNGVRGYSSTGTGVGGQGGASGAGTGVYGAGFTGVDGATFASGPGTPIGVFGRAESLSGGTVGVYGFNKSSAGTGVFGFANSDTGATTGVRGNVNSINGIGVYGIASSATGITTGVLGSSSSSTGRGVTGFSSAGTGVYGVTDTGFAGYFTGRSYFDGSVGIGISTPIGRLNIVGTAGEGRGVQIDNGEIKLRGDGSGHFSIFNRSGSAKLTIEDSSPNFGMNTPPLELMTITRAGNIGIGTNDPGFKLHVNGATRTGTLAIDSYFAGTSGFTLCANTGNNQVGLCPASSLRYKTNIANLNTGLETIMRLRPVTFDWKESGDPDLGLIAEEVEKVDPSLVLLKNDRVEGVKYDRIPVVIINAVKEQQAQIEEQARKLAMLRKEQQREAETSRAVITELRVENTILEKRITLLEQSLRSLLTNRLLRRRR